MSLNELRDLFMKALCSPLIAGAVGAIISVLWHKPAISIVIMHILAGVFSALYGTQPIVEWQGINENLSPFISLIIGAFAGSLFSTVFNFIHSGKLMELVHDFISHRYTKTPPRDKGGRHD